MDGQDEQDNLVGVFTVLSSTIAYAPKGIPPNPLAGSWAVANTHPIIERVRFLCHNISS